MLRFIEFIARFREYFIFAMLVIISIALMNLGNGGRLGGFRTMIVASVGLAQRAIAWLPNPITVASENAALRELTYRLNQEVVSSRRAIAENERLRRLLNLRDTINTPSVAAHIVGRIRDKSRYYLTLNVGLKDSIAQGMAVVNYEGLVGYVNFVSENYCTVQTMLDRNTRIAARIERTLVNGIVSWENTEMLWLKNIPKTEDVRVGDVLLTSSYSSRYPPNIPVARVVAVSEEQNSLFHKIQAEPVVRFATLDYVIVSRQQPSAERLMIEEMLEKQLQKKR
jgi:rod shape-determining protein MreC